MQIDPKYSELSALIEQKRALQPGLARSSRPVTPASPRAAGSSNRSESLGGAFRFEDAASRAREAMAARNPALAARLRQAQAARATQETTHARATGAPAGAAGQPRTPSAAPVTRDLLAVPGRPSGAPGLGRSIDTYA